MNSKKFWRTIKQLVPHKKGTSISSKINLLNAEGQLVEEEDLAEFLNEYFVHLGDPTEVSD